jgi:FlaA1/EpsC-like NDP-sugar epimerase
MVLSVAKRERMVTLAGPKFMARPGPAGAAQAMVDSLFWMAGLVIAAEARFDFEPARSVLFNVLALAVVAAVLQRVIGHRMFLYRGRCAFGSFDEVRAVSSTVAVAAVLLLLADLCWPGRRPVPASTPLIGGVFALVMMLAIRYMRRLLGERATRPDAAAAIPVLLFGAGIAGTRLVSAMLRDPAGKYLPVGLIDDDPAKRNLRVDGVRVLGGRTRLAEAVANNGASTVVFAVPSAPPSLIREVRRLTDAAGAVFKVLPSLSELLDHRGGVSDIRDVDVTDLLGRGQIETDVEAIAGYLTGRSVLVTGAGGSIGSELCRQIHRYGPAALIMLDRDESALHAVQLSLSGRALLDDPDIVLADLRDAERIDAVFAERRPEVVFHAAALKHLPLLEQYPAEAVKTNVWGTIAVLEAAAAHDVEVFVNISTDKAANPSSVLGYSKRVTERLTADMAARTAGRYLSVRFGNVLGSRGSVLTAFTAQIAGGGPITVTHPGVTRYFMTVQEACQLVIQAGAVGSPGEALVLDMGEPVSIADVARQMAALAGGGIDIVYTGLRTGEKLHEELFGEGERDERPLHPLISHVAVPPLAAEAARAITIEADHAAVAGQLIDVCGGRASLPVPAHLGQRRARLERPRDLRAAALAGATLRQRPVVVAFDGSARGGHEALARTSRQPN